MERRGSWRAIARRVGLWAVASLLVGVAGCGAWLAILARPSPGRFEARRAPLASAAVGAAKDEAGGFVSQPVRLTSGNGLVVDIRVLRPSTASGRLPVVVLLGGHRTGRNAVDLLGAPGLLAVAALDYPYDGPERPRGLPQSLSTIPAARRGLGDTPAAVLLAVDWLVEQPWADPGRVELAGVSLGVPFAMVAGALDPRVRRVWLIHGGADTRRWIEHNLRPRIESASLRWAASGLINVLAHGPSLDAGHWMPMISPRPVVVIGARNDRRLPEELVELLHAAGREPKRLMWFEGGHVDRKPEVVRQLLDIVRRDVLAE